VTIQDIQGNPQDISNFYLANIYQAIADPNSLNISNSPPASPPPFSPPNSAVWVNALWFLSLVISLTCALLATLLQQWARRYLKITHSRYSPHKRARIRAFFSEGVEKFLLPRAVESLPTLLHISLFLFFAGLVVFLFNVNLTIFKLVLSWAGLCTALYGCITCMPIIRHDSPYYTPLSLPAWHIVTGLLFSLYRLLRWFNWSIRVRHGAFHRFRDLEESCRRSLVQGIQKTAEETALNSPPEIDTRAFMWTFDCLDEDHELEHFFSGLPGFRKSNVVQDPIPNLTQEQKSKLYWALNGLLDRTFSSDLLPAPVKNRRAIICAKAVDPEHMTGAFSILNRIFSEYEYSGPLATGIANILRGWGNNGDDNINVLYAQFAIAKVIATRQPHDESWYTLVSHELSIPEALLQDYAAHGDSLLLVILIHVVRQQFTHFQKPSWPRYGSSSLLTVASIFDAKDTSQELQHAFCALWNQIVSEVQEGHDQRMAFLTLGRIRNVFLSLHQDTDSAPTLFSASTDDEDGILWEPSSYPVCKVPGHHSDLIHGGSASVTISRPISHDREAAALFASFLASSPAPTSVSARASLRVPECLTNALPLDENMSVSFQTRITTEPRSSSPNPIIPGATHGGLDTPRGTHFSTLSLERTAFTVPPKSNLSKSPSDAVAVKSTTVSRIPSSDVELSSLPSPTLALDNIVLPIGIPSPLYSAGTGTDHTLFSSDFHFPMVAPAAGPCSLDPVTSAEGEESAKRQERERERERGILPNYITVTPDDSSQLPPRQPIVDVAISGLSRNLLDADHTGEYSYPHSLT
jgi:hypothetical protein